MTPERVPFRSMHLVPSNSTLNPWCAYAEPARPSRPHTTIDAPASLTLIAFFLPLEDSTDVTGSRGLYNATRCWLSRLRTRRFGFGRRRFGELGRVDARIRLHLAQLDRRSAVGPGDNPAERYLDTGDSTVIRIVDLCGNHADRRVDKAD